MITAAFNPTVFTDLKANVIQVVTSLTDSSKVTRLTLGSTNALTGNLTVSGTSYFMLSQSTAPRDSSASIGITPTREGQLAYNSTDRQLCFSTGTTRFTWVAISSIGVSGCGH